MWPFGKRRLRVETPADRLLVRRAETSEGQMIINQARRIAVANPHLTDGQCIRAAYWGAAGEP